VAASVRPLAGADVLARQKPGCGLVTVGAFFPGLPDRETDATAGITWLLARAALRRAGGMDAEALAERAERLGGSVAPGVGAETVGWSITVRPDAIGDAVGLIRTLAADAELLPDEVVLERDLLADDAARARDDMFRYPMQQVLGQAFPGDPYGLPTLGTPESVRSLTPERLLAWAERLRETRPIAVAVGDAPEEALLDALGAFKAWPAGTNGAGASAPPAWAAGRGNERRGKAQSALAMAFSAPPRSEPERYPLRVIASLLSGLAGRLFEELRERRALAYTVHVQPWLRRRASAMLAYIATSPDREPEARDAMLAELERLSRDGLGPDELQRARNYAAGQVAIRRQHAAVIMSELADAWLHGTLEELDQEEDRLRAVTAEAVSAVARRVFVPAERAEYVVRGTGRAR